MFVNEMQPGSPLQRLDGRGGSECTVDRFTAASGFGFNGAPGRLKPRASDGGNGTRRR